MSLNCSQLVLVLTSSREAYDKFCSSNKGGPVDLNKFYVWRVLKGIKNELRNLSHVLPDNISGNGSSYVYVEDGDESGASSKTTKSGKKKGKDHGDSMKRALNSAIQENGLGKKAKNEVIDAETAAFLAQKTKTEEAQTCHAKALLYKGIAESDLFTEEQRQKAKDAWFALAGL